MNKQKSITVLSVLLALIIACMTPLAMAAEVFYADGEIQVTGHGVVWQVDINAEGIAYDDIEDVVAFFVTEETGIFGEIIEPKNLVINEDKVQLVFDRDVLPASDVEVLSSGLAIVLKNEDVWLFAGPGFTSSFRPR